jgi:hypothetical protein
MYMSVGECMTDHVIVLKVQQSTTCRWFIVGYLMGSMLLITLFPCVYFCCPYEPNVKIAYVSQLSIFDSKIDTTDLSNTLFIEIFGKYFMNRYSIKLKLLQLVLILTTHTPCYRRLFGGVHVVHHFISLCLFLFSL